jgi:uncharacterized protein (DUF433 family)
LKDREEILARVLLDVRGSGRYSLHMKRVEIGRYLVSDPEVCHGELTFKGTRILVETVLSYLAAGRTVDWVLAEWPRLSREAVQESLQLATAALLERYRRAA